MYDVDIKPRIDDDGVGWCDVDCEQCIVSSSGHPEWSSNWYSCVLLGGRPVDQSIVCPVHARRMAQWAERAKLAITALRDYAGVDRLRAKLAAERDPFTGASDRLTTRIAELEAERDRLRVECEAWRSESLYCCGGLVGLNGIGPLTIEEAVDALMTEKGRVK